MRLAGRLEFAWRNYGLFSRAAIVEALAGWRVCPFSPKSYLHTLWLQRPLQSAGLCYESSRLPSLRFMP